MDDNQPAGEVDRNAAPQSSPYLLAESPEVLRESMRQAEWALKQALRIKSAAEEDVRRAESAYRRVTAEYVRALEVTVEEQRLNAPNALTRSSAEPDVLDVDVQLILRRLESGEERARRDAEEELRKIGIRAVGPLLRIMQREAVRRDRWCMTVAGVSMFAIVLSVLGMVNDVSGGFAPLYLFLLLVLLSLVNSTRPTKLQKRAAQELAKHDDARVIGPLADGLELDDPYTRGAAAAGLRRLLPRVRASDAGLISREHLRKIYRALDSSDLNLTLAILKGLEQIGDEEAVPHVEKLTHRPAFSELDRKVRTAARECIPALQSRLGREGIGATLLRAAQSPPDDHADLVRPAAQSAPSGPESLLRAAVDADGS